MVVQEALWVKWKGKVDQRIRQNLCGKVDRIVGKEDWIVGKEDRIVGKEDWIVGKVALELSRFSLAQEPHFHISFDDSTYDIHVVSAQKNSNILNKLWAHL